MQDLLAKYSFLDISYVKAIDGRLLTAEKRESLFNYKGSKSLYGKKLNPGEVGCALSHRKAYEMLSSSTDAYALILEDDISIQRDLSSVDWIKVNQVLNNTEPRVLMLSGDYWYFRRKDIVRLYSAVGAYAYIINKAAARLILSEQPPRCVADDWTYYKRKGIKLYALYPYLIDANMNMGLLGSDVKQDQWSLDKSQMGIKEIILGAMTGICKRLLKFIHHFEAKVRIIDNNIV